MTDDGWTRKDRYYSEHGPTGDRISASAVRGEWAFSLWISGKLAGIYPTSDEAKRAQKEHRDHGIPI